ncbi:MAG TPA: hypothetical protein VN428_23880 [Bryobacteraceae bacterium]|nr:hypothetical protein [Bryobacteraceae bacterium]
MRLVAYLLTACVIATAQPASVRGRFFPAKPSVKGSLAKLDADQLKLRMTALTELLAAAASPFEGCDAVAAVRISADPQGAGALQGAVTGTAEITLRPARGSKREPESLTFRINALDAVLGRPYLTDESGEMYIELAPVETIGGHHLYRRSGQGSPVLVITRPGLPAFRPVTRERVIRARLAEASRLFEQMSSAGEAAAAAAAQAKERVAALTAELSATSAAELAAPAEIGGDTRVSGLTDPGAEGARRVVGILPLSDPSLSGAIRILTLEHSDAFGHRPELEAIRRKVDLARAVKIME